MKLVSRIMTDKSFGCDRFLFWEGVVRYCDGCSDNVCVGVVATYNSYDVVVELKVSVEGDFSRNSSFTLKCHDDFMDGDSDDALVVVGTEPIHCEAFDVATEELQVWCQICRWFNKKLEY